MKTQNIRYHGTITAIDKTKTGHTVVQLDRSQYFIVVGFDEGVNESLRNLTVFDNILYERIEAPVKLEVQRNGQRKPEVVTFQKPGAKIITVQMSDAAVNRLRRLKERPRREARKKEERLSAVEQADLTPVKGA